MSHYPSVLEYKTKLQELHDRIKENPFRKSYEANIRFGKGYFKLVYEFAETFYHLTKDVRDNKLPDITSKDEKLAKVDNLDFIHDFYSACGISQAYVRDYEELEDPEDIKQIQKQEELLELDISCIHTYLETGIFDRYPSKIKGGILWSEWSEETQTYEHCSPTPIQVLS